MKMEVDNNNGIQPIQQIKFAYGQEWRRINFSGHSFEGLCTEVKKILGLQEPISIKYQDEDNDWITVGSDVELLTAFQIHQNKVIRMTITVVQNQTPSLMEFREITPSNIPTNPNPTTTTTTVTSQPQTSYQEMSTWNTSAPSFVPSWYNNNNNHNNANYGTPSAPTTAEPVPMTSQGVTQSPFVPNPQTVPYATPVWNSNINNGGAPSSFTPDQQMIYYKYMKGNKPWKMKKMMDKEEKWREREHKMKDREDRMKDKDDIKGKMAARFVRHVTIDDDTPISPGTAFIKTWKFRNESTFVWPANTCLVCVGRQADNLSGPDIVPVDKMAAPGEEVDVSIPLVAPLRTGRYVGYYRLAGGPKGKKFGQRVRVQVQVI